MISMISIKPCYCIVWSIRKATNMNKGKPVTLLKCAVDNTKKLRFIKEHQASGSLNSIRIKTSLSKTLLVGPLLENKWNNKHVFNCQELVYAGNAYKTSRWGR